MVTIKNDGTLIVNFNIDLIEGYWVIILIICGRAYVSLAFVKQSIDKVH